MSCAVLAIAWHCFRRAKELPGLQMGAAGPALRRCCIYGGKVVCFYVLCLFKLLAIFDYNTEGTNFLIKVLSSSQID